MNMLRKLAPLRAFARLLDTNAKNISTSNLVLEQLSERELLCIQGDEVVPFLQGLITNDMQHLQSASGTSTSMYAMFLNKASRVLYDSIIYNTPEPTKYLIECDKHVTKELCRHMRLFRVRRKIEIEAANQEYRPWIAFDPNGTSDICFQNATVCTTPDPRVRELGIRILATPDKTWAQLATILKKSGEFSIIAPTVDFNYRAFRYRQGVGEGVDDIPPGKCFPLEVNCDYMHGVSFQKGCYLGQELTARVFHTGVIRKRLMPLRLSVPLNENVTTIQTDVGTNVGTIRGVCQKNALAVIRVEPALNASGLKIDGNPCYVEKPKWWPTELPKKASLREGY